MVLSDIGEFLQENWLTSSFVVALTLIYYIFTREPPDYPPGPWAWPVIGNLWHLKRSHNRYHYLRDLSKKYGEVVRVYFGQLPVIFISGYENVSTLMETKAINRPTCFFTGETILQKKGISWTIESTWTALHKLILTEQQDPDVRSNMENELRKELSEVCNRFKETIAVDPDKPFNALVLNLVNSFIFGKRFDYKSADFATVQFAVDHYLDNSKTSNRPESFLPFISFFTKAKVQKIMLENSKFYSFIRRQLEDHRRKKQHSTANDLLFKYICSTEGNKNKYGVTDDMLIPALAELYFAANASFVPAILFGLFYLMKNPSVQNKCREEINKNIEHELPVTLADKERLPYCGRMIKETLRIGKPIATAIFRTTEEGFRIGKYKIPPKSVLLFDVMSPQLDANVWEDPDEFNPDRWTSIAEDPKEFIPFGTVFNCSTWTITSEFGVILCNLQKGGCQTKLPNWRNDKTGPRKCIGRYIALDSLFLILTNLIKNYELVPHGELSNERGFSGVGLTPKPFKMFMKRIC